MFIVSSCKVCAHTDCFEVLFRRIALAVCLILVNFAIGDGRSNWAEGWMLMMAYVMLALVAWYYDPQAVVGAAV